VQERLVTLFSNTVIYGLLVAAFWYTHWIPWLYIGGLLFWLAQFEQPTPPTRVSVLRSWLGAVVFSVVVADHATRFMGIDPSWFAFIVLAGAVGKFFGLLGAALSRWLRKHKRFRSGEVVGNLAWAVGSLVFVWALGSAAIFYLEADPLWAWGIVFAPLVIAPFWAFLPESKGATASAKHAAPKPTKKPDGLPLVHWQQRLVQGKPVLGERATETHTFGLVWAILIGLYIFFSMLGLPEMMFIPIGFFFLLTMPTVARGVNYLRDGVALDGTIVQHGKAWLEASPRGELLFKWNVKKAGDFAGYSGSMRYADLSGFSVQSEAQWEAGQLFNKAKYLDAQIIYVGEGERDMIPMARFGTEGMATIARVRQRLDGTFYLPKNQILAQFNARNQKHRSDDWD